MVPIQMMLPLPVIKELYLVEMLPPILFEILIFYNLGKAMRHKRMRIKNIDNQYPLKYSHNISKHAFGCEY